MTELFAVLALGLASNAGILWFASKALKAQREASDDIVRLAREALAGGRIIAPEPAELADAGAVARRLSQKKWDVEQVRKVELARLNDVYFGDERVPPVQDKPQ